MPGSFYGLSIKDSTPETGRTEFNIGDLTAVSLAGALAQMGDLKTALLPLIEGAYTGERWGDADAIISADPTSATCQRGIKWTVLMRDTVTGVPVINHIPTAKLSLLPLVSGHRAEDLDLTANPGLAFKTALEALVKSPAGNSVVLQRVYYSD